MGTDYGFRTDKEQERELAKRLESMGSELDVLEAAHRLEQRASCAPKEPVERLARLASLLEAFERRAAEFFPRQEEEFRQVAGAISPGDLGILRSEHAKILRGLRWATREAEELCQPGADIANRASRVRALVKRLRSTLLLLEKHALAESQLGFLISHNL